MPSVSATADDDSIVGPLWPDMCDGVVRVGCDDISCDVDGVPGIMYGTWTVVENEDGEDERKLQNRWCQVPDEEDAEPTPGQVLRAFQRLEWPKSELVVQPPDGKTLVNFDTNFLTENADPTRQRVTLLGQRIVIEAEPTSYVWDFGDGDSLTTETPGARYPDLEVTHKYLKKATYQPSVDTVYTGRYRVNGGPWIQIPETLTVEGDQVELTAIEATPVLVAPDGR